MSLTFWNRRRREAEALALEEAAVEDGAAQPDADAPDPGEGGTDGVEAHTGTTQTEPPLGAPVEGDQSEDEAPAGNASKDDWTAYALAHGKTEEDLTGLNRDAIRDLFA